MKTFLNEMHISAFQQLQHSSSQTNGDGLQMAHGASRCVNGPRGLHNPLTQPPPSPALIKLPAGPRQGAAGWGPGSTKPFQFPQQFPPHPCNVLAAVEPLFQFAFNLPNASSHRGDPKPCRTSRNAKHLQ